MILWFFFEFMILCFFFILLILWFFWIFLIFFLLLWFYDFLYSYGFQIELNYYFTIRFILFISAYLLMLIVTVACWNNWPPSLVQNICWAGTCLKLSAMFSYSGIATFLYFVKFSLDICNYYLKWISTVSRCKILLPPFYFQLTSFFCWQ